VHERLEVDGVVCPLAGELEHYSFRDWADQRSRSESYARLWAESRHSEGRRAGALDPIAHAAFTWVRGYLMRGGVLEGPLGLRIANACARETAHKYALLRGREPAPPIGLE
jgi:hypothetical protein